MDKARQFLALDGLRGVAAIAVLLLHVPEAGLAPLIPKAYLAVDFFFALSGFVLAYAYEQRLRTVMGPGEFMLRRYIRLWPLYVLGLAIGVVVEIMSPMTRQSLIVSTGLGALFLPVLWPEYSADHQRAFPLNGPAWSLFSELLANLAFAFAAPRLTRVVLGAILAAGAGLLLAVWFSLGDLNAGASIKHFAAGPARVWWSFFGGVAIHRLWLARPAPRLPSWLFPVALVALLVCPYELISVFVGFPVLIYFAASARPTGLEARACTALGAASYAIYVIHKPIVEGVRREIGFDTAWAPLALVVAIVLVAWGLNYVFDGPARRLLERLLLPRIHRRAPAPSETPAAL